MNTTQTKKEINNVMLRRAMKVYGNKWTFIIIMQLETPKRFGEIKKGIPDISEKILIERLKIMTKGGIVRRKDYKENPPRVEYSLTESGKRALSFVPGLIKIGERLEDID